MNAWTRAVKTGARDPEAALAVPRRAACDVFGGGGLHRWSSVNVRQQAMEENGLMYNEALETRPAWVLDLIDRATEGGHPRRGST